MRPPRGTLAEDIPFLSKPYDDRRLNEVLQYVEERLASA